MDNLENLLRQMNEELEMAYQDLEAADRALGSGEIDQKQYDRDVNYAGMKISVITSEMKRVKNS